MRRALALALLVGCNQLIGVHDYGVDAGGDACTAPCECVVDTDCSDPHAVCLDQSACVCAAGYGLVGTTCTWVGVVDDPGFERSPDRWMTSSGATTLTPSAPQAMGMQDPGILSLTEDMLCHFASITQAITMPRFSRSEPLVISTTYNYIDGIGGGGFLTALPALAVGTVWYENVFPATSAAYSSTRRACLGPGQYAPESTTGLGAPLALNGLADDAMTFGGCYMTTSPRSFNFDHVEILPAAPGECPLPGEVTNGNVEGIGGWLLSTNNAAFDPCPAPDSTRCVHLHGDTTCAAGTAAVLLSVPVATDTASAALSFYHDSTYSNPTDVYFALDRQMYIYPGAATLKHNATYCLPAATRGGVFSLQAFLNPVEGAKCADGDGYVDNVAVANDSKCGVDPYIADPGFESGYPPMGAASSTTGSVTSEAAPAPNNARSGAWDLKLDVQGACGAYAQWTTSIVVPSSIGQPALVFHYRQPGHISSTFSTGPATTSPLPNTADGTWKPATICLDPRRVGRAQTITFTLQQPSPMTCPTSTEDVYIDDLAVMTDPTCPVP